ncbi:Phosphatidylinositol transfer protein SFH5 [Balamuthia mandrillaris]
MSVVGATAESSSGEEAPVVVSSPSVAAAAARESSTHKPRPKSLRSLSSSSTSTRSVAAAASRRRSSSSSLSSSGRRGGSLRGRRTARPRRSSSSVNGKASPQEEAGTESEGTAAEEEEEDWEEEDDHYYDDDDDYDDAHTTTFGEGLPLNNNFDFLAAFKEALSRMKENAVLQEEVELREELSELEAIYRCMEERENDFRVAAEIGQMLVGRNKQLTEELQEVESEWEDKWRVQVQTNEELLRAYNHLEEEQKKGMREKEEAQFIAEDAMRRLDMMQEEQRNALKMRENVSEEMEELRDQVRTLKLEQSLNKAYKEKTRQLLKEIESYKEEIQTQKQTVTTLTKQNASLKHNLETLKRSSTKEQNLTIELENLKEQLNSFDKLKEKASRQETTLRQLQGDREKLEKYMEENENLSEVVNSLMKANKFFRDQQEQDKLLLEEAHQTINQLQTIVNQHVASGKQDTTLSLEAVMRKMESDKRLMDILVNKPSNTPTGNESTQEEQLVVLMRGMMEEELERRLKLAIEAERQRIKAELQRQWEEERQKLAKEKEAKKARKMELAKQKEQQALSELLNGPFQNNRSREASIEVETKGEELEGVKNDEEVIAKAKEEVEKEKQVEQPIGSEDEASEIRSSSGAIVKKPRSSSTTSISPSSPLGIFRKIANMDNYLTQPQKRHKRGHSHISNFFSSPSSETEEEHEQEEQEEGEGTTSPQLPAAVMALKKGESGKRARYNSNSMTRLELKRGKEALMGQLMKVEVEQEKEEDPQSNTKRRKEEDQQEEGRQDRKSISSPLQQRETASHVVLQKLREELTEKTKILEEVKAQLQEVEKQLQEERLKYSQLLENQKQQQALLAEKEKEKANEEQDELAAKDKEKVEEKEEQKEEQKEKEEETSLEAKYMKLINDLREKLNDANLTIMNQTMRTVLTFPELVKLSNACINNVLKEAKNLTKLPDLRNPSLMSLCIRLLMEVGVLMKRCNDYSIGINRPTLEKLERFNQQYAKGGLLMGGGAPHQPHPTSAQQQQQTRFAGVRSLWSRLVTSSS